MSILSEIIKSVEENERNRLHERLPVLFNEIHIYETEIFKQLDEFYVEFTQKPVKIPHLTEKLQEHQTELKSLIACCEQSLLREMPHSKKYKEYQGLLKQANNLFQSCAEVCSCYHIHEKLVDLRLYHNDCEKSLRLLEDIRNTMFSTESQILRNYFEKHFISTETTFYYELGEKFKSKFMFGVKENGAISYLKVNDSKDIEGVISIALKYSGYINEMEDLSDFIWEYVIVPIVTCGVVMTANEHDLKLKIMREKKPYYKDVFIRLQNMCNFLNQHFNTSVDKAEERKLLDYIGNRLENKISSLIISNCLVNISRNSGSPESVDYENIIQQVEGLQADLNRVKLVSNNSLVDYSKDLPQIDVKKNYDNLFDGIKGIMSQKNYDIIKIGSSSLDKCGDPSSDLSSMSISTVVQELHLIIEKNLLQAQNNKSTINVLFDILHYYRCYTSKDILSRTPQEVALVHNNFIYIAHELRDWNMTYNHIVLEEKTVPLFKAESLLFQTAGEEILESFLLKEKNELKKQLSLVGTENISSENFNKIFIKSLNIVDSLIEAWYSVLANSVFVKCIGICMNVLCSYLIEFVLNSETIDKDLLSKISTAFNNVVKVCEKFFVKEEDLKKSIECWEKFRVLTCILKSDLIETIINKHHELLKLHFKVYEVKKILRSIFGPSEEIDAILLQLYDL